MGELTPVSFGEAGESLNMAQSFLVRYGYMSGAVPREARLQERTSKALQRFQSLSALPVSGEVDARTLREMERTRCGVRDWIGASSLRPCPWPKGQETLFYELEKETQDVDTPGDAFGEVREAARMWNTVLKELHIPLEFKERTSQDPKHISIRWDFTDLDLGLLEPPVAHADLPPACGVVTNGNLPKPVHFNDKHTWRVDPDSNVFHIYSVALHELGHILGLVHPPGQEGTSIMACTLLPMEVVMTPADEDKKVLLDLYRLQIR